MKAEVRRSRLFGGGGVGGMGGSSVGGEVTMERRGWAEMSAVGGGGTGGRRLDVPDLHLGIESEDDDDDEDDDPPMNLSVSGLSASGVEFGTPGGAGRRSRREEEVAEKLAFERSRGGY